MDIKGKLAFFLALFLSILAVYGGLMLNFQEFQTGSPANAKNLIVTLSYFVIWIFIMLFSLKSKSKTIMSCCLVFWIATFMTSLITIYVNASDAAMSWAIPFVILLLGPWYGMMYFTERYLDASIIIAVISIGFSATNVILMKCMKKNLKT